MSKPAKKLWKWSKKASTKYNRIRRFQQKEETQKQKKAQGKGFLGGGMQVIQVEQVLPSGQTVFIPKTSQADVKKGFMDKNSRRSDQTRAPFPTPPMQEPLYSTFTGEYAEEAMLQVLQGQWQPSDIDRDRIDPITICFLNTCRYEASKKPIPLQISVNEHINFWSKMDESRGSEPTCLHNGHFKAGAISPGITFCDTLTREIPLITGMAPKLWRVLMNFHIPKKREDIVVGQTRTIQMMPAELQAKNKKAGHEAMRFAKKHKLLPDGQYGSRKGHQAINQAMVKQWVWDQSFLERRAAAWICNNATSCFDRVVHWIAILCMMRLGIQFPCLSMMFGTLAMASHRVRSTGFGDSAGSFRPPSDIPYQGCGQSNGAGPTIWVSISVVIIAMLEALGICFESLSALSGALISVCG